MFIQFCLWVDGFKTKKEYIAHNSVLSGSRALLKSFLNFNYLKGKMHTPPHPPTYFITHRPPSPT